MKPIAVLVHEDYVAPNFKSRSLLTLQIKIRCFHLFNLLSSTENRKGRLCCANPKWKVCTTLKSPFDVLTYKGLLFWVPEDKIQTEDCTAPNPKWKKICATWCFVIYRFTYLKLNNVKLEERTISRLSCASPLTRWTCLAYQHVMSWLLYIYSNLA